MAYKISLDRQFIHSGKLYGPGDIELDGENAERVASDLKRAQERVIRQDAEHRSRRLGDLETAQKLSRGEAVKPAGRPSLTQANSITYTKDVPAAEKEQSPQPQPAKSAAPKAKP